jgi:hypothetical protein
MQAYDEVGASNDELLFTLFGKYLKDETRALTGIISDILKRNPNVSYLTTDMIRNVLTPMSVIKECSEILRKHWDISSS